MLTALAFGAALTAPGAPVPRDVVPAPVGPAPWVVRALAGPNGKVSFVVRQTRQVNQKVTVTVVENGKQVTRVEDRTTNLTVSMVRELAASDTTFTAADGTPLTADVVTKRAKNGLVMLISADGKPVHRGWLRAVHPDVVVVASPGLASITPPIAAGNQPASAAAPRLVLLATEMDGKVRLAYNPNSESGVGANDVLIQANGRVIMVRGGIAARRIVFNGNGQQLQLDSVAPTVPTAGRAPTKPLEEVQFDAYDLDGKAVARENALKRLRAGGLVLIASGPLPPDADFLKLFTGDLLVLVSAELNNVPQNMPLPAGPGRVRPLPIQAVPLPIQVVPAPALRLAPAPARILKPALNRAVPRAVVPAPAQLPAKPVKE